ncbi:MAG: hypothetical protein DWQ05_22315 [Calditrichaeota bacterium]|nr:MAG: hypothetical protein DWQ05_22315 [Calditrichota bacterium]
MKDKNSRKHPEAWADRFKQLRADNSSEIARDEFILDLAKSLQEKEKAPLLWAKIENNLREEKQSKAVTFFRPHLLLRVAAVFILVIGTGVLWQKFSAPQISNSRILSKNTLQKVISTEKSYEAAIAELEKLASPKIEKMELELMFLYRDKLAIIDEQIEQCREELSENPGNAHIRRYMLAALQDKKETLQEIVQNAI